MDWSEFVLPQSYQFRIYFTLISQNYITFVVMQREPKFKIIVHFIEEQIQNGTFGLGDQIPSVNALRIRFGLSRSSIFLAMEDLKSRGTAEGRAHGAEGSHDGAASRGEGAVRGMRKVRIGGGACGADGG